MKALNNLFAGLGVLGLVILFVVLVRFSGSMSVYVCLACIVLYKIVIGTPFFIKKYYKMKGYDISWFKALIPYYNESTIMSPKLAIAYLSVLVVLIVECVGFVLPPSVTKMILGESQALALDWYVLVIRVLMVTYVLLSVIRGIAYIKIFIDIEETKCELNNMKPRYSVIFILSSIIGFIPIARTFALAIQNESLRKATLSLYLENEPMKSNDRFDWNNY